MSVLGLDVGTSGARAVVFAADGTEIADAAKPYSLIAGEDGRVELDPAIVIAAAESCVAEAAVRSAALKDPVESLSISVLGEAVVPVDSQGAPLAPFAVSMDRRGDVVAEAWSLRDRGPRFTQLTGQPLHGMFSVFKIMAGDAAWRGAAGFRCAGDLLTQRWTGEPVIDDSMAARTGLLDVAAGAWSQELIELAAEDAPWIRGAALSRVARAGSPAGSIGAEAALRLGLRAGVPVIAGAHDQAAAFLGAAGAVGTRSVISLGSSDCITVGTEERPAGLDGTGFATYRVGEGLWVTLAGTAAGGWALEWFARTLGRPVDEVFGSLTARPPALLMLPYLAGSGTLDNDPRARGVIHGLTLSTAVPELARAVVESAGFEFAKVLGALEARGVSAGDLAVTGAGSRNAPALQARAEALGRALTPAVTQAAARGAGILACRGIGLDDIPPAPTVGASAEPTASDGDWYEAQRVAYRELYRSTASIAAHLSSGPPDGSIEEEN